MKKPPVLSSQFLATLNRLIEYADIPRESGNRMLDIAEKQFRSIEDGVVKSICKIEDPESGLLKCSIQIYDRATGKHTTFDCPCGPPVQPPPNCPHMFDFCKMLMDAYKGNATVEVYWTVDVDPEGKDINPCIYSLCIYPKYCCLDDDTPISD